MCVCSFKYVWCLKKSSDYFGPDAFFVLSVWQYFSKKTEINAIFWKASHIWSTNYFRYHGILFLWAFCSVGLTLLCSPGYSWTHYIARDDLESWSSCLCHLSAGFKVWTTTRPGFPVLCFEGNSWNFFLKRSVGKSCVYIHMCAYWWLRDMCPWSLHSLTQTVWGSKAYLLSEPLGEPSKQQFGFSKNCSRFGSKSFIIFV